MLYHNNLYQWDLKINLNGQSGIPDLERNTHHVKDDDYY